MSKTNCINCGAAIDIDASECPFCRTPYVDMDESVLRYDKPFAIRVMDPFHNKVRMMRGYISNTTVNLTDNIYMCRDSHGHLVREIYPKRERYEMHIILEDD